MPQFIPTLVFLNYLYVLFSPSPRKINNRKNPTFVTSFHLTFSQLPWRCHQVRSSPWMGPYWINVADWNLWPMKPGFSIGLGGVKHRPPGGLVPKKSNGDLSGQFLYFLGGWIFRKFWRCQNWQAFDYEGIYMTKKDSDHQDVLDLACHFGNFPRGVFFSGGIDPRSKQGCLKWTEKIN